MLSAQDVNAATLLFLFLQIRQEIFLTAANHRHETNAAALGDSTGPSFQLHKTPVGEIVHLSLLVRLRREKEELHSLFLYPDLRDAPDFVVVEHARTKRLETGKFSRHIVMLEAMFQEKEIA